MSPEMPKKEKAIKPFIVDMRHDEASAPSYIAAWTWEDALQAAGAFWEKYDGVFAPKLYTKQPFRAGEGYDQANVYVVLRRGSSLDLQFANGEGPCIRIERAEKPLGPPPKL